MNLNNNWREQLKTNLKTNFDNNKTLRFVNLFKQMIEAEIQNQKDLQVDFIATVATRLDLEDNQKMMLYFERNINYFENQLKNL